ncbi:metallophosphoesterase [Dysgonomonas sp. 511]|uniref:metallophosphoesterase n=1 Tax=Dysgonomonas sp. 511 TaxID=2302930 RepID=UPI0013D79BF4|nr:metallophosphoesterase [Dysgonomonas sp. 511]NDV77704.1 acid phosphatase [Dysgonomonas sp. 511]
MKKISGLITLLLFASTIFSQIKITHGPYLCDMDTDGVTIVWTTDKPALSWVEIAPEGTESFYQKEHPKYFDTAAGRKRANQTLHRIRISGLEDGTKYRYRIFSKEVTERKAGNRAIYGSVASTNVYSKKPLEFTTFAKETANASFLVLNDIHGKSDFMKELCKDIDFKALDFVAMNGDMSTFAESEEQLFDEYIDASVELYASETPIVYTRGNHETRGVFADELIRYFPTRNGEFYQMFSVGSTCFLVLDCGEDKPDSDIEYYGLADYDRYREEEARWLAKCVETEEFKSAKTRIVFLHIPPPVGDWHGNHHLQQTFMPILNRANIDVMFSGHTHRFSYHEPNSEANFPIVVNGNKTYVMCKVGKDKIDIEITGLDKKDSRHFELPVR